MPTASNPGTAIESTPGVGEQRKLDPPATRPRPVLLVLGDYYLPGYKGGGTIRSLANLIDRLGGEFDFRMITRDRDLGASAPFPEIRVDAWQRVGGAEVFYASPQSLRPLNLLRIMRSVPFGKLYLNSFFSPRLSIAAVFFRAFGLLRKVPIILAPRGEFAPGALALKHGKKRLFLRAAKLSGAYRSVIWQATSELEEKDIRNLVGPMGAIRRIGNLSALPGKGPVRSSGPKTRGSLSLVYLSRIARNKNLVGALASLRLVRAKIDFHIYGPKEDQGYWSECETEIAKLPANITVRYGGPVENHRVPEVLCAHDVYFLPTMGENFGHSIAEALRAGLPALVSDRTPWHDLEAGQAGWAIPLERHDIFAGALESAAAWGETEWRAWSDGARRFAARRMDDREAVTHTRNLLGGHDGLP